MDSHRSDTAEAYPGMRNAALLAGFVLAAAAIHVAIVAAYANAIPYSDEWIAIIDDVLRRSANGQLSLWDLFQPHNEHTMVPTRLLALIAIWLNHGQFDNVPVAMLNALLYALTMAIPVYLFFRHGSGSQRVFAIVLGVLALAPIEGEDLIFGFQNQYYFMLAGTFAALWLAATTTRFSKLELAGFTASAFFASVSMGSGFFVAFVAAIVCGLRWWREPQHRRGLQRYMLAGSVLTLFGIILAAHAFIVMKRVGILGDRHLDLDGIRRIFSCMAWPFGGSAWLGLALAAPFAVFALRLLDRRRAPLPVDYLALGLGLWTGTQICALAYSRHSVETTLASRYLPVILLWPAMNLYALFRLADELATRLRRPLASAALSVPTALAAAALIMPIARLVPDSLAAAATASDQHRVQAEHLARYVRLGDRSAIDGAGHMQVPYGNRDKLRSLLDDPAVRAGLPANVRAPLELAPAAGVPTVFVPFGAYATVPKRDDLPGYGSYTSIGNPAIGTFQSRSLDTEFPYVRIDVAGYLPESRLSLELACPPPATCKPTEIRPAEYARESWQGIYARVPQPHFRIVAADNSQSLWMAFSAPIEVGRLSVLTDAWVNRLRSQAHAYLALLAGALGLLLVFALWRVPAAPARSGTGS